jgi:hypothetical protein
MVGERDTFVTDMVTVSTPLRELISCIYSVVPSSIRRWLVSAHPNLDLHIISATRPYANKL